MTFGSNKSIYLLIIFSIVMVIFSYKSQPKYNLGLLDLLKKNDHKFIAHAGGGIDNFKYTNSIEAINQSINNGFKLIEIDLHETTDNIFVGIHDWENFNEITTQKKSSKKFSLAEINKLKIYNKYTPITVKKINEIFLKNEHLFLVTDKTQNFKKIQKDFTFGKERILVEIFGKSNFKKAIKQKVMNPIYNYNNGDYKFVVNNNIKIISASIINILNKPKEFKKLLKNDIFIFAYSSNEEKVIKNNIGILFTHVYTDFWDIQKMKCYSSRIFCKTY